MSVRRQRIVTITDEITALGMKLAGMGEVVAIKEGESATNSITDYANDPTVAFIMITEVLAEENRLLLNKITQRPFPVVVEIPGPEGKSDTEGSTLKELVRRALGIEMDI